MKKTPLGFALLLFGLLLDVLFLLERVPVHAAGASGMLLGLIGVLLAYFGRGELPAHRPMPLGFALMLWAVLLALMEPLAHGVIRAERNWPLAGLLAGAAGLALVVRGCFPKQSESE